MTQAGFYANKKIKTNLYNKADLPLISAISFYFLIIIFYRVNIQQYYNININ